MPNNVDIIETFSEVNVIMATDYLLESTHLIENLPDCFLMGDASNEVISQTLLHFPGKRLEVCSGNNASSSYSARTPQKSHYHSSSSDRLAPVSTDLLKQYVNSLEGFSLLDREGEERLCQAVDLQYQQLAYEISHSHQLIELLIEAIAKGFELFGPEHSVFIRANSEDDAQKNSTDSASSVQQWYDELCQLFAKASVEQQEQISNIYRDSINKHLSNVYFEVSVLKSAFLKAGSSKRLRFIVNQISQMRDALVHANLRLVISVARQFKDRGVSYVDLIQEGNLGLLKAAARFDYRKGFKFSTYAHWWIWQSIKLAISKTRNTIRVPSHLHDEISKAHAIKEALSVELNRDPTVEEIAQRLNVNTDRAQELLRLCAPPLSLDAPLNEEGTVSLENYINSELETEHTDALAVESQNKKQLKKFLDMLTPRERLVIKMRYGIDLYQSFTLDRISDQIGLTRERVRQIEKEAIEKIRRLSQ